MGRIVRGNGHTVPAEVLDARTEASAVLAAARAEAERIKAQAGAVLEEARQQGYAAGKDAAAAEALTVLLAARAEAAGALEAAKPAALSLAAKLATKMAAKIVGRAVDLAPAVLADIAGEALRASRVRAGRVVLRVNPADHATLIAAKPELHAALIAGAELQILADGAVSRYGCVVETASGRLDARLETQLAVLEKALAGRRPHG